MLRVREENVHCSDVENEKLECIDHKQKRMGSRLKNFRNELKANKLSDGKKISELDRCWNRTNPGLLGQSVSTSLDDMVKSIWSI